jgi:PAS domain S-box-containing protein
MLHTGTPVNDSLVGHDAALRHRLAEIEEQNRALQLAAEQADLVRQQFLDLYDYAPVGYVTVDEHGVVHRSNLTAAALLGETNQSLVGTRLSSFARSAERAACASFLHAAFRASGPTSCELALARGKWRAEHVQLIAAPAASGRDLGHAGAQVRVAIIDITARRKVEEAQRASQQRFESAVSAMAEGVVVLDASGVILSSNTAAERILDLGPGEMVGRKHGDPAWRVVHEDGSPFLEEDHPVEAVLRTGIARWNVLMGIHAPDRPEVWLRVSVEPLRGADRSVQGAVVTFGDATEERRRGVESRETQEHLARVLEVGCDGHWEWELATGRIQMSARMSALLGGPAIETVGYAWNWPDRVDPGDRAKVERGLAAAAHGKIGKIDVQYRVRVSGGAWKWLRARGGVVERGANGEPVRLAGIVTDITDVKVRSGPARRHHVRRQRILDKT